MSATAEFYRSLQHQQELAESFAAASVHLASFPQPFAASASFATAQTPWYLDYGHLTF